MYRKNITLIDELPELDDVVNTDINRPFSHPPPNNHPNVNKFIRPQNNFIHNNSGMNFQGPPNSHIINIPLPPLKQQPYINTETTQTFEENNQYQEPIIDIKNYINTSKNNNSHHHHSNNDDLSCVTISHHIKKCPICSQLYGNSDRTIYLIIIFFLCLFCLILIKKVLNL